jgi:hypothetical protein
MALNSVHPLYADMRSDWDKMRDVYRGERHVKAQGAKYLPPTKGMRLDGYGRPYAAGTINLGQEAYDAYVLRAVLPDYVEDAVDVFVGLLHSQEAQIELPTAMEPLREKITSYGESLELLLRRINVEQLITGRVGLLLDLPKNPDPGQPLPYVAIYVAESIINWDDAEIDDGPAKLNLVVLDESSFKRNGFDWQNVSKYRVLELEVKPGADGKVDSYGNYRQGVFEDINGSSAAYVASDMAEPMLRNTPLENIPFVFINSSDLIATPDKPPLLGLANAVLTIFRGEADYRQNLFMQGQDTLVVKGDLKRSVDPNDLAASVGEEPLRTGTGAMIHLEGGADNDAKYIGVESAGLSEQRTALENDRKRAEAKAGALSSDTGANAESGEALKTRVAARTASLNQIAKTGAAALEWILKQAAEWMGADPDKVKVTPNLEFADFQMTGDNLNKLMAAKAAGAPLSKESIHQLIAQGGLTEMDFKTEKEKLDEEANEALPPPGTVAGGPLPIAPVPAPGTTPAPAPAPAPAPTPPKRTRR